MEQGHELSHQGVTYHPLQQVGSTQKSLQASPCQEGLHSNQQGARRKFCLQICWLEGCGKCEGRRRGGGTEGQEVFLLYQDFFIHFINSSLHPVFVVDVIISSPLVVDSLRAPRIAVGH